ncbi:hypothetical protein MVEN_02179900 [Mycena venus]|uniref:Uncharacterized protein n=1 Tax=Mycena venus TaxID=2733690 RepID=A0A8H6X838_9AGAR|nr:hypothetical protein MVEN_02179900 [Mycena venus]
MSFSFIGILLHPSLIRLDKLAVLRGVLALHGVADDEDDDNGILHGPRSLSDIELAPTPSLAACIQQPELPNLLRCFLHEGLHGVPDANSPPVSIDDCPIYAGNITVHHSAIARFYAPSDLGGAGGMYRERIHANPNWHGYARRDTVSVNVGVPVMHGIVIGRVLLFFSFVFTERVFECAPVNWLVSVGDVPDPDTGMWVVELEQQ